MEKENDNKTKILIVVTIILVLISLFILFIIKTTSGDTNDESRESGTNLKENYEFKDITNDNLEKIKDENLLFYGQNTISAFLGYSDYDIGIQLLSENYINNYKINKNNYSKIVLNGYSNLTFKAQSGKMLTGKNHNVYYALYGYLIDDDYGDVKIIDDNYVISLLVDYSTNSYAVYPNSDDVNEVLNGETEVNVKRNSYNKIITSGHYNRYDLCSAYFNDFIFKIYYDTDLAYSYLNDETKRNVKKEDLKELFSRYSTIDSCEEITTNRYLVYNSDNQEIKIVIKSIMDYNVSFEVA